MTLNYMLRVFVAFLIIYALFINPKKSEPKNISMVLIAGSFGILSTDLLSLLKFLNPNANISVELNYIDYFIAAVSLIAGIILNFNEKKQFYVFNLLGENNKRELINDNYRIKNKKIGVVHERSIDFMTIIEKNPISAETNKLINEMIIRETETINNFSTNEEIYMTSMASIPHSMLFGTYLIGRNTIKYLNYNRFDSEFVLLPEKNKKKKPLDVSIKKDLNETKEVLVSISVTFPITEQDIVDFNLDSKVFISTNSNDENNISSQEEIKYIANEIVNCLIEISNRFNVIHIVAAIPGMLSIELGKIIRNRGNQLSKIIIYHYNSQSKPVFKWGIVIKSDESSGNLIQRG